MKITSTVYANQALKFGDSIIEFKNGAAEIDDELFKEIQSSGFPNIYAEGKNPGVRTKSSVDFDKTLKEVNTEYMEEIDRLKNVNASKTQEIKELKQQLANLKIAYDKDVKALQGKLSEIQSAPTQTASTEETAVKEETETSAGPVETEEEKEVRKDLESMKLPELQKIAVDQGNEIENLKKLTKKELIDVIMGKTE